MQQVRVYGSKSVSKCLCSRNVYEVLSIDGISYLSTLTPIQLKVDYGGGYYTGCIFVVWEGFKKFFRFNYVD